MANLPAQGVATRFAVLGLLAAALSGCTVGPDFQRPAAPPVEGLLAALADSATPLASVASGTCNALEHAVCRKFPLLAMLRETLLELGCLAAHVSGSGGTVYGICPPGRQEEIRAAIAARMEMPLWTFASVAGG
jgi:4-diphosphocytidyl-2C-methyl-D-erythritol kinase